MFAQRISSPIPTVLLLLALAGSARAQDRLQFTFHGKAWTTNASGKVTAIRADNQSWLQEYALSHGITNVSSLALVYHLHGDPLNGDTIEVVDATTGEFLYSLYGLYKGTTEGRIPLANTNGTQVRTIQYVYGDQLAHSAGTAYISERYYLDGDGHTNRTVIQGQIRFLTIPDQTRPLQITSGSFITGKPFPASP
jgi:hypothetical protein